jgi:hypothetical protein
MDGLSKTLKKSAKKGDIEQESVLLSGFKQRESIGRIFDNGRFIAFQDQAGIIYIFNPNLTLAGTKKTSGLLLGLSDNEVVYNENGFLLKSGIKQGTDTLCYLTHRRKAQRFINGFYLSSDSAEVFLQHLN